MRQLRISIAGLMGLILVVAVGLAALHHPTRLWSNAAFSLAIGLDFGAVVAAIASEGRARSACSGFAVCGWGYLVLAVFPWFEANVGPQLITTPWIESGYQWIDPEPGKPMTYWDNGLGTYNLQLGAGWDEPQPTFFVDKSPHRAHFLPAAPYSFFRIAHSLFGIAAGMAGGLLACALARGPGDPARSTTSNTGNP
jgi:hypothetical protein